MTAEKTWLERYVDERMCEHEESIGLRELNKVGREAGQLRDHKVVELSIGSPRSRSVETEPMTKSTSPSGSNIACGIGETGKLCPYRL